MPAFAPPLTDALHGFSPSGFHRVAYTDWGDPGNPHLVICVHGLTRNGRDFDFLAQRLAGSARVICPDIVGRGDSDWLPDGAGYGYPQYLADMAALIARVTAGHAQAGRAVTIDWVGTSMGGLIGMMLAAAPATPIRRLVMNDVGPVLAKEGLTLIGTYAGDDPRFDSEQDFAAWFAGLHRPWGAFTASLDDDRLAHFVRHGMRTFPDPAGHVQYGLRYDPAIAAGFRGKTFERDVEMWPIWDRVTAPALILRGRESTILRAETAQKMTQRDAPTTLIEYAGIGHAPALASDDQIEPVARFLLD